MSTNSLRAHAGRVNRTTTAAAPAASPRITTTGAALTAPHRPSPTAATPSAAAATAPSATPRQPRWVRIAIALALLAPAAVTPVASAATGGASTATPAQAAPATSSSSTALRQRTVVLTPKQLRSVQRRVRVRTDGVLGAGTRSAIRRFQLRRGLKATGRPNVETLRALGLKLADKLEAKLIADAASVADDATPDGDGHPAALAAARSAIGTPYRSGGTTTAGFDCSGLVLWAMRASGIALPRTSFQQYKEGVAISRGEIQAGDLVFFNSAGAGASHVGIATGPTKVISATSHGVMEHRFDTGYWNSHYVGARRV